VIGYLDGAGRRAGRLALVVIAACSIAGVRPARAAPPESAVRSATIDSALGRARSWLDTLQVDCVRLDRAGLNGKKRLAEMLEVYLDLSQATSDPAIRHAILDRVARLTEQTRDSSYHDLTTCPDAEFKANSLSYLRVAWLMRRFGLELGGYSEGIAAALPRIEGHLAARGPWQRRMFAFYFQVLGLPTARRQEADPLRAGVIARRLPLERFDRDRAYDLTHEVFAVFEADSAGALARFGPADREYLGATLSPLARRVMALGNIDLAAELLTCLALTGQAGDPDFALGIRWLLEVQDADGSWERQWNARARRPSWIPLRDQLHTTLVAVEALTEALRAGEEPAGSR
jgi:hypothetical protein